MEIIRGKIQSAQKVVIYGPEGIGKSTFASQFPDPLFIDTEGSTKHMDVARFPKPSSWAMLLDQVRHVRANPALCRTLVVDTIDWAEQVCIEAVCAKHNKSGIEDFGYGNGYTYVKEELGRFLNLLEDVVDVGVNVVLTAHAQLKKFEQPDELGSYDRYELKLGKKTTSQTSPLVKEWADMVLFANYKTIVFNVDGKGAQKGKNKAQGGKRVMYATHNTSWDAKNRHGLADELPFDYTEIAYIFSGQEHSSRPAVTTETKITSASEPIRATKDHYYYHAESDSYWELKKDEIVPNDAESRITEELPKEEYEKRIRMKRDAEKVHVTDRSGNEADITVKEYNQDCAQSEGYKEKKADSSAPPNTSIDSRIPKALVDLMVANGVDEWDIQNVVEPKGYVPTGTPVWQYEEVNPGFTMGVLVGAWNQVYGEIKKMKATDSIVFN